MASPADGYDLDQAVRNALPQQSVITSIDETSKSTWSKASSISVSLPNQTEQIFFLKTSPGSVGRTMLLGEFTASTAMHKAIPTLIAKPIAWGEFESSNTYFILSEHRNIDQANTDPEKFVLRLVELHRSSTSENGMFGFPVSTCDGAVPLTVAWQQNWATFYTSLLRGLLDLDNKANGHWRELDEIFSRLASYVIPRLLGVLQSGSRELRPSLIHGDMWSGNYGTDVDTGEIIFVDASSFYAHNELELGLWQWADGMAPLTDTYLKHFPPSEPAEEWRDRHRLYSLKTKLNMSVDHPGEDGRATRKVAYNDMVYLCERYAPT